MSELFGVESHTTTYHLKEIYQSGELQQNATTRKIRVVQNEGNREVSRLDLALERLGTDSPATVIIKLHEPTQEAQIYFVFERGQS
ncbi:MAG: hypothetical protein PHF92_10145 [Bacteroidales bacterium]|nr:hypothetical protein [Bacteroidales bacterium]